MVNITIAFASKYHTTTLKVALTRHRIVVSFFTQKSIGGMNKKMTWNLKGIPYMTSDTQTGFSEVPFGFGSAPKPSKRSRRRMIWEDENNEGDDDVDEDSDEV